MKPILFNTEMVKAILDGRKTTTRRVIKPQPICMGPNITFKPHNDDFFLSAEKGWLRCRTCGNDPEYSPEGKNISHHWKPSYQPGDVLYVRETYANIEIAGHPETRKDIIGQMAIIQMEYHGGRQFSCQKKSPAFFSA